MKSVCLSRLWSALRRWTDYLPSSLHHRRLFLQLSLADLRHSKNVCLHREQVRDIKFSPEYGHVLSTSFDRTLKVYPPIALVVPIPLLLILRGWAVAPPFIVEWLAGRCIIARGPDIFVQGSCVSADLRLQTFPSVFLPMSRHLAFVLALVLCADVALSGGLHSVFGALVPRCSYAVSLVAFCCSVLCRLFPWNRPRVGTS